MHEKTIFLSIIIPSYNRQESLDDLITTIDKQANQLPNTAIELIIVDDGSQKKLKKNNQLTTVLTKWIRLGTNYGAPYARKMGYQNSSGKYIHFHDSDDSISATWLHQLCKKINANKKLDCLVTGRWVITQNNAVFKKQKILKLIAKKPTKIKTRLTYENCLGPLSGVTFSRQAVAKMRFNNLPSCQDWDMYLDAITDRSIVEYDWSNSFIKNDTQSDQISKNIRKKCLGVFQLARIHNMNKNRWKLLRLSFVYKLSNHTTQEHEQLKRFYSKNIIQVNVSHLLIELLKKL